ncbi:hypothetical protein [Pseudarthrobacter sp. C4D7]|uniref:hypothetical protein n=1 Tax=Pseudarthrobacter sp. C4D7 TaxID=2735268 RepID=UPI0015851619|nr:hypothetical protein [Pseudarthrobacter sp. C4D7]NUT70214.1 hypothetical protein [Pseudarthrobacter sp. C4D7]
MTVLKRLCMTGASAAVALAGVALLLNQAVAEPVNASVAMPASTQFAALAAPARPQASLPAQPGSDRGPRPPEVLPPVQAPPRALPLPAAPAPLIRGALPAAASARNSVVRGFPSTIVSFPDKTVPVFTAVSPGEGAMEFTAEGITPLTPEQALAHFQQSLLKVGFRSDVAPTGQSIVLVRGKDQISVSAAVTGTGATRFSLLGRFHTGPGK